jgi:hypothetical protein
MVQTFVHSSSPGSTLTEPDFLSKVMPILLLGTSKVVYYLLVRVRKGEFHFDWVCVQPT